MNGWSVPRRRHTWNILGLLLATLCGCSASPSGSTAQASTEGSTSVLKGAEWAQCWVEPDTSTTDPTFQRPTVKCTEPVLDPSYPLPLQAVIAQVLDAKNVSSSQALTPGSSVVVATTSSDGFPLTVTLQVVLKDTPLLDSLRFLPEILVLDANLSIASVTAASVTSPIIVKQPFDLWPIAVVDQTRGFIAQSSPESLSLAPLVMGSNVGASSATTTQVILDSQATPTFATYIVAPPSGSVFVQYSTGTAPATQATISGPGSYTAEASGFHPTSQGGPAPVSPASDAGTGGDADSGSTCGTAGQPCCVNPNGIGTCGAGDVCESSTNQCAPCGEPGQACCFDANGNGTCGSGSLCNPSANQCVACGGVGQQCCLDANGNGTCASGGLCNQDQCVACGQPGQVCCDGSQSC
jgi:hypothetical protein